MNRTERMDGLVSGASGDGGAVGLAEPLVLEPSAAERAAPSLRLGDNWFEQTYREAAGDSGKVPWAHGQTNPMLVAWLNSEATGRVRPGARSVVVGCGLGDDVVELINRGYDACGFDVSPTAVEWARKRFPEHADSFFVADLLAMPAKFKRRFDLVVEIYTIQSLEPSLRERAAGAISQLACPRGTVLTIARGRDEAQPLEQIPMRPYPLTARELTGVMAAAGMRPLRAVDDFVDDGQVRRLRGAFTGA